MFVKDILARIEDLEAQGREAIKAEDKTKADEIKGKLKEAKVELKEAIEFAEEQEVLKAQARQITNGAVEGQVIGSVSLNGNRAEPEDRFGSDDYRNAVLDDLRGLATTEQAALIAKVNNHSTGNTGTVIPNTVVGRIWTRIEEAHPMYADIPKTRIAGSISYDRNTGSTDNGSWLGEDEKTPTVEFEFDQLDLHAHELSKSVEISFKLEAMSRADFENHLVTELAKKMGKALAVAVYSGTGKKMPQGIKTALFGGDKKQITTYSQMEYTDITAMFALLKSGLLSGAIFYTNNYTAWNILANILDKNGRPLFIPAVTKDRIGTILGTSVRESAEMSNGELLLGNHEAGYKWNTQPSVTTGVERDNKNRVTGHYMHAIADGGVLDEEAYVLAYSPEEEAKTKAEEKAKEAKAKK